MTNMDILVIH